MFGNFNSLVSAIDSALSQSIYELFHDSEANLKREKKKSECGFDVFMYTKQGYFMDPQLHTNTHKAQRASTPRQYADMLTKCF